MKIGILTQPLLNNYGGLLQNFALQQVLLDNGHKPITMDWRDNPSRWKGTLINLKREILHIFNGSHNHLYNPTNRENAIISKNNRNFIDANIITSSILYNSIEFRKFTEEREIEAFVVGSDQCWRPLYSGGFLKEMFLSFAENMNIKRISYAASFGTDKWEFSPKETSVCNRLAKQFDLITVREESGVELCKNYLGVEAIHLLDPTMLHDKTVYEALVESNNTPKCKGSLFHYILDPSNEKSEFINKVADVRGLIPFTILPTYQAETRTRANVKNEIEKCVFPCVTSWLRGFMDANMIICDSFHGCVFSIIFNKPFWVISNEKRGNARFNSLLKMFGLEERLVDITQSQRLDIDKPIEWDKVNQIRLEWIKKSKSLLLDALK